MLFAAIALVLTYAINEIPALARRFPNDDLVFSPYRGSHAIAVRIFVISFFVAFCCVLNERIFVRVRLAIRLLSHLLLFYAAFDIFNLALYAATGLRYTLEAIEIMSGIIGFFVFAMAILESGRMPERAATPFQRRFVLVSLATLVAVVLGAIGIVAFALMFAQPWLEALRAASLLGGIGPGVVLFLPTVFLLLYAIGRLTLRKSRAKAIARDFSAPVTVLVPAHNEEHILPVTLHHIDEAAAAHPARVEVVVLNNASRDRTLDVANAAIARFRHAEGRVVDVPKPGKAHALNTGLDHVKTDLCIRIDADTLVRPNSIRRAVMHFVEAHVGVVGGLPLPMGDSPFTHARFVEVMVKHAYYQPAMSALNGVVSVPGMFAAYRTRLLREVGGFATHMNGEDTDVTLRIAESGYRVVVNPRIRYHSEVPSDLAHMREQRQRWFRSVFHVSARNRDYLDRWWITLRGKIILPYMLMNSARRAMMIPLIVFGMLEYLTHFSSANTLAWQQVVAVMLGAPAIVAVLACLVNGYPKALLYIPEYLFFRAMRAYFTLESILSISYATPANPQATQMAVTNLRRTQEDSPARSWTSRSTGDGDLASSRQPV